MTPEEQRVRKEIEVEKFRRSWNAEHAEEINQMQSELDRLRDELDQARTRTQEVEASALWYVDNERLRALNAEYLKEAADRQNDCIEKDFKIEELKQINAQLLEALKGLVRTQSYKPFGMARTKSIEQARTAIAQAEKEVK
jgi:uncharacterized phage infection (PIP) family protein YhgE